MTASWHTLPGGAGGLVTGLHIALDGTMVCRTDVGNAYLWSGKSTDYADPAQRWNTLFTFASISYTAAIAANTGAWELVLAPGNSSVMAGIFFDPTGKLKNWLWYSTNKGAKFNETNVAFINNTAMSNASDKQQFYKVAIDPANENVGYCGMPYNNGNTITGLVSDGTGGASGTVLTMTAFTYGTGFNNALHVGVGISLFSGPGGTNYGTITGENTASSDLASISGTTLFVGGSQFGWSLGMLVTGAGVSAGTFVNGNHAAATASGTASSISGTTFTPGGTVTGTWIVGMALTGAGVQAGTWITANLGGGNYSVNVSQTVASTNISGSINAFTVNNSQTVAAEAMSGVSYTLSAAHLITSTSFNVTDPSNNGYVVGVWTSLNKAGGSSIASWTPVITTGTTTIAPPTANGALSAGLAFDPSVASGTVVVGGQTVSKHVILPVGGVGIYETTDGGVSWAEIAVSPFGTADFQVVNGGFTAEGAYYCVVVHPTIGGIWRLKAGAWTNITSGTFPASNYGPGYFLIIDPRANPTSEAYLSVTGGNGIGAGYTATDANTGSPPNWSGTTGGEFPYLFAASYDIPYLNYIFGQQGVNGFIGGPGACMDLNGVCFWGGSQSIWYFGNTFSATTPLVGGPSYRSPVTNSQFTANTSGLSTTVVLTGHIGPLISAGNIISARGIPPGTTIVSQSSGTPGADGTYVISAAANLSNVLCGVNALITYSWSIGRGQEATVGQDMLRPPGGPYPILAPQDLGAPMRGTFTTYPQDLAVHFEEYDCSSLEYAANDSSFVVACTTGQQVNITSYVYSTNYGSDGSWNVIAGPEAFWTGGGLGVQGGQVVAVSHDDWMAVPQGNGSSGYVPAYTSNATAGAGATWALTDLPSAPWTLVSWIFASPTVKPFAVGYGTDQNTVWAFRIKNFRDPSPGTADLYRSTNKGQTFGSPVLSLPISPDALAPYCLSVPGWPDELWITSAYSGGSPTNLWHVTGARTGSPPVATAVNLPVNGQLPQAFTLGAPAIPGGYPTLYLLANATFGAPDYLYEGQWDAVHGTVTWTFFGDIPAYSSGTTYGAGNVVSYTDGNLYVSLVAGNLNHTPSSSPTQWATTGTAQLLPLSCQIAGFESIRGDWDVYRQIYTSNSQSGFAFFGDLTPPPVPPTVNSGVIGLASAEW